MKEWKPSKKMMQQVNETIEWIERQMGEEKRQSPRALNTLLNGFHSASSCAKKMFFKWQYSSFDLILKFFRLSVTTY